MVMLMRNAVILLALLLWPLLLPSPVSARFFSLHGPFDQKHKGVRSGPPPSAPGALSGCARGRYRESGTHQCRGPADLR